VSVFEDGYALLIGVDDNAVPSLVLPDVAKDVVALRDVLVHPERCAYRPDHVKTITGATATRQAILDGLDWLADQVRGAPEATAVVYYSGHGFRHAIGTGAEFYLVPYDVRASSLSSRALRAGDFADVIERISPRRLLMVLDCCHAAGMQVETSPGLPVEFVHSAIEPGLLLAEDGFAQGGKGLDALVQGRGRAVLSSSTDGQSSYLRRDGSMSVFTYHFVEALTGHAQPQEGAIDVLVSDVISYVHRKVPTTVKADWGQTQTPDYLVSGNFPVALLLGGKGLEKGMPVPPPESTLTPPRQPAPTYTAFDQRGQTVHGSQSNIHGDMHVLSYGDTISIHGDGNVVGNGSQSTVIRTQTSGVSLEAFQRLLADLAAALTQAKLDPVVAEMVTDDLENVQTQVAKPKPNAAVIVAKLGSILGVLGSVDGVWGLTERVRPMVEQAIEWTKVLFK